MALPSAAVPEVVYFTESPSASTMRVISFGAGIPVYLDLAGFSFHVPKSGLACAKTCTDAMAASITTTTYPKARFIDIPLSLSFNLIWPVLLTRGVNVVSVEPEKSLAKYAGLHAVSTGFVHKTRLSKLVSSMGLGP